MDKKAKNDCLRNKRNAVLPFLCVKFSSQKSTQPHFFFKCCPCCRQRWPTSAFALRGFVAKLRLRSRRRSIRRRRQLPEQDHRLPACYHANSPKTERQCQHRLRLRAERRLRRHQRQRQRQANDRRTRGPRFRCWQRHWQLQRPGQQPNGLLGLQRRRQQLKSPQRAATTGKRWRSNRMTPATSRPAQTTSGSPQALLPRQPLRRLRLQPPDGARARWRWPRQLGL